MLHFTRVYISLFFVGFHWVCCCCIHFFTCWGESIRDCQNQKNTEAGSSIKMKNQTTFGGILHNSSQENPVFYNWNRVQVNYCDGSSFTGDVNQVDPETKLYFKGARIFKAVLQDLWSKGLQNAENAILSENSAGGLATILNFDKFKSFSNDSVKVKCVANAGFFINKDQLKTYLHCAHLKWNHFCASSLSMFFHMTRLHFLYSIHHMTLGRLITLWFLQISILSMSGSFARVE